MTIKGAMQEIPNPYYSLVVPRNLIKTIKDALQAHGKLNKRVGIKELLDHDQVSCLAGNLYDMRDRNYLVPTTVPIRTETGDIGLELAVRKRSDLISLIGMQEHAACISLVVDPQHSASNPWSKNKQPFHTSGTNDEGDHSRLDLTGTTLIPARSHTRICLSNPLAQAIQEWLLQLAQDGIHPGIGSTTTFDDLTRPQAAYMIYPPMLLLPPSTFSNWPSAFLQDVLPSHLPSLYNLLCQKFKVTHIALNAPISANILTAGPTRQSEIHERKETGIQARESPKESNDTSETVKYLSPNILRSPNGLTPLFGDFGPVLHSNDIPKPPEFSSAFWCTARQNNIFQTWTPRYTMFSRGNISEKARILKLHSLTEKALKSKPEETSVVDLYAGIGYFAFCYVKKGVGKVLCWEINGWSVEGLRRGAKCNKWAVRVVNDREFDSKQDSGEERLLVFQEGNENAVKRVSALRGLVPPIRHVSCGLLPSSQESWGIAVQVLDAAGGWIHAHENIAKEDLAKRREEIVKTFSGLVNKHYGQKSKEQMRVECEHLERVKTYAPGVVHCVLDIAITPVGAL
ncbi:hypothetical protein MMC28_001941 [Mycoblastus sanguinarius]|nr:hypothetical protein [Mycoblastus sanguinarius]